MKIQKLVINNIGIIGNETIEFNKPLNLFYGDVRQGKTTILNAIKLCFGGGFPDDIIKHGEKKASVELHFDGAHIERKFRKDKHGITKADKIEFVNEDGEIEDKPVDAIQKFLNPFLLNQDHLVDMNEPSRKRYFIDLFGVDTVAIDSELKTLEDESKDLRISIKAYGDISTDKVEPVNIEALETNKKKIVDTHEENYKKTFTSNEKARHINDERKRGLNVIEEAEKQIAATKGWLEKNPEQQLEETPLLPDTSEIDIKIGEGREQNVRYEQYLKDQGAISLKAEAQDDLADKDEQIRDLRSDKASLLSSINDKCTIKGLKFDEAGNFEYEGTTAGMLSTSQLMRLSSELGKLYPEGFGLELIDRGESIGKDIFLFVKKAQEENKTILATIVGEKPANIPEEIGVFVVDNGEIK
ncbi:MAG: ATP-binding protein [Thermodesulfobacteriota bacterium]